ncbi:hypothetical protein KVV02_003681 [Mortierella alpina]|uniref:Uncharacterized protein n=1 Tax=Mortierella alpina TaxID=64518 RepID=A0A9P8A9H3_MORAP|nr:hypothetical protein KVV02_003681 [Mortierella alpina]
MSYLHPMRLKLVVVTLSAVLAALVAVTSAHKPLSLVVKSKNDFCMPLPSKKGGFVAENLGSAKIFCTKKGLLTDTEVFPPGFIQSLEIKSYVGYVQVTGVMDRTVFGWNKNDTGTKIHPGFPEGLQCQLWNDRVMNKALYNFGFIEPDVEHFCFRCCHNRTHCDINNSQAKESKYRACLGNLEGKYDKPVRPPVVHTTTATTTTATLVVATATSTTGASTTTTNTQKPPNGAAAMGHSIGLLTSAILFAAGLAL